MVDNTPVHNFPFTYDDAISRGEIQPVILFGAPRSGTQMYRDMICSHRDVSTWPYNEMTYMWRYGNRDYPTDEIPVDLLSEKTAKYIRNCFIKLGKKSGSRYVLDKTCHNCLRPAFVSAVLPEAKYIYLIRHGMDVVPSVIQRLSTAPPKGEYKRIFSIPVGDVAHYVKKIVWNHGGLFRPGTRKVRMWGPRFAGMEQLAKTRPVEEVCAYQWVRHMHLTDNFLNGTDISVDLLRVRYEEITRKASTTLSQVFDFLEIETPIDVVEKWEGQLVHREAGSRANLLGSHKENVHQIVSAKNAEHGYN